VETWVLGINDGEPLFSTSPYLDLVAVHVYVEAQSAYIEAQVWYCDVEIEVNY